jgi:hypothetical protein
VRQLVRGTNNGSAGATQPVRITDRGRARGGAAREPARSLGAAPIAVAEPGQRSWAKWEYESGLFNVSPPPPASLKMKPTTGISSRTYTAPVPYGVRPGQLSVSQ